MISTLQRGLQAARSKYVYFAAADDWVAPGFFELALRRLEANPDVGLFCGEASIWITPTRWLNNVAWM